MTDKRDLELRLVSSTSKSEVDEEHARRRLTWPLRELTANLLRTVRGAGKPYAVAEQIFAVANALQEYREAAGCWPSEYDIRTALDRDARWPEGKPNDDMGYGIDEMVDGSLQIAASQLVGQMPQEAAGRHQLFEGLKVVEDIRAKNWAAANKSRKVAAPRKARPKL
ncbi:hypothetical protein SKP52_15700 [Sphingopyxis fribergensis]|uniref:Uncharacterized protein n=1 Tax=Sphingopyxis fribergensis TaxID=1515612 RepID=A0A0A7PL90_9SPHN|nr:hypothetical protein [Sphingopyxis fribergensis]AJA10018.1 hypothetical protein SKP52_15700 [Sphingopyxis fribergensis]